MKIGVIRQDRGTEVCSTCSMETFLGKVKKENKGKYISQLREQLPSLQGSEGRFLQLDKIPRIYPVAEYLFELGKWDGHDRIREMANG